MRWLHWRSGDADWAWRGAASSSVGSGNTDLDFASVQRDNAEMERRAPEVIRSVLAAR